MKSISDFINNPDLQIQEKQLLEIFNNNETITILDIGSCEGESSIRYSKLYQQATIYAFEPLPDNFKRINSNIQDFNCKNIFPFQLCLSDKNGEADFYVSSAENKNNENENWDFGNKSSSLLSPDKTLEIYDWLDFKQKVSVTTQTLTDFYRKKNLTSIDFIHMDVQGAELLVLSGAGEIFDKINAIWLEVEVIPLYKNQPLKKDVENFLLEKGFSKIKDTVTHVSGDQFWINDSFFIEKKGYKVLSNLKRNMMFSDFKNTIKTSIKKITRKLKIGEKLKMLSGNA